MSNIEKLKISELNSISLEKLMVLYYEDGLEVIVEGGQIVDYRSERCI